MKKVMLIGDSIRLCYQDELKKVLKGEYEIWGSDENNRFAKYTLNELGRIVSAFSLNSYKKCDEALLQPTVSSNTEIVYPDVIHWNNGLWDTAIVCEEDGAFTPIDEYISYMKKILRELRKMTNNIIFATTTPVKPENPNQKNDIIVEYNKKIIEFMKSERVVINDLYALVASDTDRYISSDNIHLSAEGANVCAKQIAEYIRGLK